MKKGDKLVVNIMGAEVGHAVVESVGEGQAVIVIPAQRVVASVRMELDLTPPQNTSGTETIIDGVDRPQTVETPAEPIVPPAVADATPGPATPPDVDAAVVPSVPAETIQQAVTEKPVNEL